MILEDFAVAVWRQQHSAVSSIRIMADVGRAKYIYTTVNKLIYLNSQHDVFRKFIDLL